MNKQCTCTSRPTSILIWACVDWFRKEVLQLLTTSCMSVMMHTQGVNCSRWRSISWRQLTLTLEFLCHIHFCVGMHRLVLVDVITKWLYSCLVNLVYYVKYWSFLAALSNSKLYRREMYKHTHTQSFNGLFSRTTWVGRYQKDKPFWIFWSRDDGVAADHMQVTCTSLQTENHASISSLKFLPAECPSCHPTNSVKALKRNL